MHFEKRFRIRLEKFKANTGQQESKKTSETTINKFEKLIFSNSTNIKHVYAENGTSLLDVFKKMADLLNEKCFTYNVNLPHEMVGSQELQMVIVLFKDSLS